MLAQALRLYRVSLPRCLPLALLGALLAAGAGAYATARAHAVASQISDLMNAAIADPDSLFASLSDSAAALRSLWHSPAVWASALGALLIELIFQGALILRQAPLIDEPHADASDARERDSGGDWLARTLQCLPSLLLVVVLFALAVVCAALLLVVSAASTGLALTVGLALLIAATWLWGQLQLWLVAMFTQGLSAVGALRASWNLINGHWWRVSTWISVPYIAIWVISSLGETVTAAGSLASGSTTSLLGHTVTVAISALTLPVLPAAWLAIYRDLKATPRAKKTPRPRG
jgi:hypothetical protein